MIHVLVLLSASLVSAAPGDFFEQSIRPILATQCYSCHSTSALGNLRVDSREGLLKGGKRGPAIRPGDAEASLLLQAVEHAGDLKMPPQSKLSASQIGALKQWIQQGAPWPAATDNRSATLWSLKPIRPAEAHKTIDQFIGDELRAQRLQAAAPADRRTWIRRVTFDLTGLPPAPEQVREFVEDASPRAFEKVVDRLLASPHYGERYARHWMDVMRYADELSIGAAPHAWHYRDWLIQAFNDDLPYHTFVKAHLAADLLPAPNKQLLPALAMLAIEPNEFTEDDRVDIVTRGFLGLTAACAQCHDHKYDPIPTRDYYALLGVFRSSKTEALPLADEATVRHYESKKRIFDELQSTLVAFQKTESQQTGQVLAAAAADYLMAVWQTKNRRPIPSELDPETVARWIAYLERPNKEHPFLQGFEKLLSANAAEAAIRTEAERFAALLRGLIREKASIDDYNRAVSFGIKTTQVLGGVTGKTMDRARYMLWQDMLAEARPSAAMVSSDATVDGILYYRQPQLDRFLTPARRQHLAALEQQIQRAKAEVPPAYPALKILSEGDPADLRIHVRGNPQNLGAPAPRAFLTALGGAPLTAGSGRLQLAEAIASSGNPLTARVIVNRVWQHHFGHGLVRTPSNFGQLGERPTHPALLDSLAADFMRNGWSLKKLHRQIVLSAAYGRSSQTIAASELADPDNRYLWRFPRRRLDAESLRDSILAVAGTLDRQLQGPPISLESAANMRRSIYGLISQANTDRTLTIFDFPSPSVTSEERVATTVALQRLFLLNSNFMLSSAAALANRLGENRLNQLYQLLFQRDPSAQETAIAKTFLNQANPATGWTEFAHLLLTSNEFLYVD